MKFFDFLGKFSLYIIYNTMWPDENGVWREWPDVYGYDDVIWKQMQPYMQ